MRELLNFPIDLPLVRIKRRIKIPSKADFKYYDYLVEKYFTLIEPVARFDDFEFHFNKNEIILEDSYKIISESLMKHLKSCSRISLLGITIGSFVEEEMERFVKENKSLEQLILDAVGSECAEEAAQYVSNIIDSEIKKNNYIPTKRFSPGYGDLDLEVQKYFFKKLRLEEIGIKLSDSLLMIPQKSVTAFIGWGKRDKYQ